MQHDGQTGGFSADLYFIQLQYIHSIILQPRSQSASSTEKSICILMHGKVGKKAKGKRPAWEQRCVQLFWIIRTQVEVGWIYTCNYIRLFNLMN